MRKPIGPSPSERSSLESDSSAGEKPDMFRLNSVQSAPSAQPAMLRLNSTLSAQSATNTKPNGINSH